MPSCSNSDFVHFGVHEGGKILTVMYLPALLLAWGLVSTWSESPNIRRKILLFLHWLSGILFASCKAITSIMILNCWSTNEAKPVIYLLNFITMTSLNLFALTDLALAVRLAQIVEAHKKCQRLRTADAINFAKAAVFGSLGAVFSSIFFWKGIVVTGGTYIMVNPVGKFQDWIKRSYTIVPGITGFFMAPVLAWMGFFRRKELAKCCEVKLVKLYFMLAIVGAVIYFYHFSANLRQYHKYSSLEIRMVHAEIGLRYVHISLDSLMLMSSIGSVKSGFEASRPSPRPITTWSDLEVLPTMDSP